MKSTFNNNLEDIKISILKYFNSEEIKSLILDAVKNNKSIITFDLNHIEKYDRIFTKKKIIENNEDNIIAKLINN